jgi:uroporphyrinogen-III synthase
MKPVLSNQTLSGRTVLVSPNEAQGGLATQLTRQGARVLAWPILDIGELENYEVLDESIANLFGYDWLIFRNENAVDFFLRRFQTLAHEISELDALRVCGVGEEAVYRLEGSQIHIDVISDRLSSQGLFDALETYVGGRAALSGLNFLIPAAAVARDGLSQMLEEAGARVDMVTAYRTVARTDPTLAQLNALLTGGGIDWIVFNSSSDVHNFAKLFGTNDPAQILAEVKVACADVTTSQTATAFGLHADFATADPTVLAETICHLFGRS